MLGEVIFFAGSFAPKGWAFCQGQNMPINQNMSLFSLLGDRFGGDGRTYFCLPKIEDQNGCRAIIAVDGLFPARS